MLSARGGPAYRQSFCLQKWWAVVANDLHWKAVSCKILRKALAAASAVVVFIARITSGHFE